MIRSKKGILAIALCIAMLSQNLSFVNASQKKEENNSWFTLRKNEQYDINWIDPNKIGKDITINDSYRAEYSNSSSDNYIIVRYAVGPDHDIYGLIHKETGVPVIKDQGHINKISSGNKVHYSVRRLLTTTQSATLIDAKSGKEMFTLENVRVFENGFGDKVFAEKHITTTDSGTITKYDLVNLDGKMVDENNFDEKDSNKKAAYKYSDTDKKNRDVYIFSEKAQKWILVAENQDSNSYDEFRFIEAPSGKITDKKAEMIEAFIDEKNGVVYSLDGEKTRLNEAELKEKLNSNSDSIEPYIFKDKVYWNENCFFDLLNGKLSENTNPQNINDKYLVFNSTVLKYNELNKKLEEILKGEEFDNDFVSEINNSNFSLDSLIMINKKASGNYIIRDLEKVYADDVEIKNLYNKGYILTKKNDENKEITRLRTWLSGKSFNYYGYSLDKNQTDNFKLVFKDKDGKYKAINLKKEIINIPDGIVLDPNQYVDYSNEIFVKNSDNKWDVHSFDGKDLKKKEIKGFEKGFDDIFVKNNNRLVKTGKDSWSHLSEINNKEKSIKASDLFYTGSNLIGVEREIASTKKYSYSVNFDKINELKDSDFIYKKVNGFQLLSDAGDNFLNSKSHNFYDFKLDDGRSSLVALYETRDENNNQNWHLKNIYKTKNKDIYTYYNLRGKAFYYSLDDKNTASLFSPYIEGYAKQDIEKFYNPSSAYRYNSLGNYKAYRYIIANDKYNSVYYLDDNNKIQKRELDFKIEANYGIQYSKRLVQKVSTDSATSFNKGFVDVKDLNIVVPTKYKIVDGKNDVYIVREKVGENTKLGVLKIKLNNTVKVKYKLRKGDFVDSDNETNEFTVIKGDLFYLKYINHRSANRSKFRGLYLDEALTQKAKTGQLYLINQDTTFYAKYKDSDTTGGGTSGGGSSSGGSSSGGSSSGGGAISPTPSPAPSKPSTKNDKAKKDEKKSETVLEKIDLKDLDKELFKTPSQALILSAAKKFTDISKHWAKNAIGFVVSKSLFKGVSDSEFGADLMVNRAMVVTVLNRITKQDVSLDNNKFKDVNKLKWYAKSVSWANKAGIVKGISKDIFAPELQVTREQLATMLYRFLKYINIDIKADKSVSFKDQSEISSYAVDAVSVMRKISIIKGRPNGNFDPKASATRAELATMMQRFMDFLSKRNSM